METRSFPTIEERIIPFIQKLVEEILLENLTEEAKHCFDNTDGLDANDFDL
jgi:hypothetical protein